MYCVQKYRNKLYLDYKYICNFKSVHILDSINVTIMCLCFSYYVSVIIDSESGWETE